MRTHILLFILACLSTACASQRELGQRQLEAQERDHYSYLEGRGSVIR